MAVNLENYDSVLHLLRDRAQAWAKQPALRYKKLGIWETLTWSDYVEQITHCAAAIKDLNIPSGKGAAILSENRPEWLVSDFASMSCSLMSNGLYTSSSPEQIDYQLTNSGSEVLFVEGGELLEKIFALPAPRLSQLRKIIIYDRDGLDDLDHPLCEFWDSFMDRGRTIAQDAPQMFDQLLGDIDGSTIAMLIYTSGTTGNPKGAMISHSNVMAQLIEWQKDMPVDNRDRSICFLPLCHVAERMFSGMCPVGAGSVIHFAESADTFAENLREIRPTIMFAPPRVFEKLSAAIDLSMSEARRSSQWFYRLAKSWLSETPQNGLKAAIARRVLIRNILRILGFGDLRFCISGAAPVSDHIMSWYQSHGIAIYELFGMTETCGSLTRIDFGGAHKSCGKGLRRTEIKIASSGELLARGPNIFQGYLNAPDKTGEALDQDGWLHTGDQGEIDENGNLKITGRIKDIIITSGGKNVAPALVESKLKASPYIVDALLIGDGRKYITGLVMIDQDTTSRFARDNGIAFTDFPDLCRQKAIFDLVKSEVEAVNATVNQVERVKGFRILDIELDAEDEELTATMKLKRSVIEAKYKTLIETMYNS